MVCKYVVRNNRYVPKKKNLVLSQVIGGAFPWKNLGRGMRQGLFSAITRSLWRSPAVWATRESNLFQFILDLRSKRHRPLTWGLKAAALGGAASSSAPQSCSSALGLGGRPELPLLKCRMLNEWQKCF